MVGIEDLICVVEVISSGDFRSGPFERHTIKSGSSVSEVSYWTRGSCEGRDYMYLNSAVMHGYRSR